MVEAIGEDGDVQMTEVDKAMSQWITQAAATLDASEVPPLELRERHLANAIKDAINDQLAGQAVSKVLDLDAWPSLGRSATDVVVLDEPETGSPTVVAELKWCQIDDDKVHEAIWDLFKVALLVDQYAVDGYLVTAAPVDIWPSALCGDLFSTGTFASEDLFARQFPKGRPIWDWLATRRPRALPAGGARGDRARGGRPGPRVLRDGRMGDQGRAGITQRQPRAAARRLAQRRPTSGRKAPGDHEQVGASARRCGSDHRQRGGGRTASKTPMTAAFAAKRARREPAPTLPPHSTAAGPRTQVTPFYLVPTWSLTRICRYQESQNTPITRLFVEWSQPGSNR
jgi:hypothetical protein